MRVLWISGSQIVGGAEHGTLTMLRLLRSRGHDTAGFLPVASPVVPLAVGAGLSIREGRLGGALNLRARGEIRAAVSELRPDAVLVTTADEWVWASLANVGARLVLARHMGLPLPSWVMWLARRRADAFVVVSDAARATLLASGGIAAERVTVIRYPPRFIPRASVPDDDERRRRRVLLGLPASGSCVAFLGGLDPAKGLPDLVEATRRIRRTVGELHLVVCGRGDPGKKPPWRANDAVVHLGETGHVDDVVTAADVVVVPSRRHLREALARTLVEAMALGTPVIATRSGGMPEATGPDGAYGRLAEPDDPADLSRVLAQTLRDREGREAIAGRALERVRELFDPYRAVRKLEEVLRGDGRA